MYEDIATTYKLIHQADHIMFLKACLYHHVFRKDSIMHTFSESNKMDAMLSVFNRCAFLESEGYASQEKLQSWQCTVAIGYLAVRKAGNDPLYLSAMKIVDSTKGIPKTLSYRKKIALFAWRIDS